MKVKKGIYFITATGWMVLISVLSLVSFSGAGTIKSPVSDKIIHAVFYLFFTILWYLYLKQRKIKNLIPKIFLFSFIYGIIIEMLQDIMPFGRHFDTKDILANVLGAFTGIILIKIYLISSEIALKRKN